MFNHTYNSSQVETEVVPTAAGRYTVIIDEVKEKISKNSGKDMLELKLKIIAAEAPEHKRFVNRTRYVYIVDDQYADQKIYDIFTSAGKPVTEKPLSVSSAEWRRSWKATTANPAPA